MGGGIFHQAGPLSSGSHHWAFGWWEMQPGCWIRLLGRNSWKNTSPQGAITIKSCFLTICGKGNTRNFYFTKTFDVQQACLCACYLSWHRSHRAKSMRWQRKAMDILYLWKLTLKDVPDLKDLVEWKWENLHGNEGVCLWTKGLKERAKSCIVGVCGCTSVNGDNENPNQIKGLGKIVQHSKWLDSEEQILSSDVNWWIETKGKKKQAKVIGLFQNFRKEQKDRHHPNGFLIRALHYFASDTQK